MLRADLEVWPAPSLPLLNSITVVRYQRCATLALLGAGEVARLCHTAQGGRSRMGTDIIPYDPYHPHLGYTLAITAWPGPACPCTAGLCCDTGRTCAPHCSRWRSVCRSMPKRHRT